MCIGDTRLFVGIANNIGKESVVEFSVLAPLSLAFLVIVMGKRWW